MRLTGAALLAIAGLGLSRAEVAAYAADIQSPAGPGSVFVEEAVLEGSLDPIGIEGAHAGTEVGVDGDTAVVGAAREETASGSITGAAYVFVRTSGTWAQVRRFDGGALHNSLFGTAVAISGDTVAVGAPDENSLPITQAGAVYVYVRSGGAWTLQQKLAAPDASFANRFGVSISLRGDTVAIGARGSSSRGAVYVFQRSGSAWSFQQKLAASDPDPLDYFGDSVSLGQDLLAIGAHASTGGTDPGAVYLFAQAGVTWTEQQKLVDPAVSPGGQLGASVSLAGDTLAAGSPRDGFLGSASVFVRSGATWIHEQTVTTPGNVVNRFGQTVIVSGDRLYVAAPDEGTVPGNSVGVVHAFARSGGVWSEGPPILASDGQDGDLFGSALALAADTLLVGAPWVDTSPAIQNAGAAYVFVDSGGAWTQQAKLVSLDAQVGDADEFGNAVAISGDTIAVGAHLDDTPAGHRAGSVYVFTRMAGGWPLQQKLTAPEAAGDFRFFGMAVAIDVDTLLVAMSGPLSQPSMVFVFTRTGGVWSHAQTLMGSDSQAGDGFGQSLFVSGDLAVIGAYSQVGPAGFDQGAAFVFERVGGTWTERQKLVGSSPGETDYFGLSVSASGDSIAIGAPYATTPAGDKAGAAYVFTRTGATWTEQQRIVASDGIENAQFGWGVSISGDTVAIGARFDGSATEPFRGSVYAFERSGSTWAQTQKVIASNHAPNEYFGWFVDLTPDLLQVNSPGSQSGYVFGRVGSTWIERQILTGSIAQPAEGFIGGPKSGGALVFGSPLADTSASADAGRAYVFRMVPTDLSVTLTDGQATAVAGTPVTYTAVATNHGPGESLSAHVTSALPPELAGAAWTCTASPGSACGASGTGGLDDRASLLVNGTAMYTLTATVPPAAATGTLTRSAAVATPMGGMDPDPTNSTASDVDALVREADLRPTMSDFPDPVGASGGVTYSVQVANQGPSDSSGMTVVDTLPTQTAFVASTPGEPICVHAAGIVTCNLPGAAAGAGQAVEIQARLVSAAPGGTIVNAVTAGGSDPDPVGGNNAAAESTSVGPRSAGALVHGASEWADLAGGSAERHYRVEQQGYSSYEVAVDGASGDVGDGEGPLLDRVAFDGQVIQASVPLGTGPGRSLRWHNFGAAPTSADFIRVRSAGCDTDCGPDDVYRIRAWDTTLRAPRFNNVGTQFTILLIHNASDQDVGGVARFWSADGTLTGTHTFMLAPRALLALNTADVIGAGGVGGTLTVGHDGGYGALVGKLVALEPATGFSFDSPLLPAPR
jgi:uncharacterized repeat protein (TIGR01451 family)